MTTQNIDEKNCDGAELTAPSYEVETHEKLGSSSTETITSQDADVTSKNHRDIFDDLESLGRTLHEVTPSEILLTSLPVRKPKKDEWVRCHPTIKTPANIYEASESRETYLILPAVLDVNVYDGAEASQGCKLGYHEAGEEKELDWDPSMGVSPELSTIDIFDTHCGDSYLSKEGEPSYEPRLLAFLTDLAGLCDRVSARLDTELQNRSKSVLPDLPPELAATVTGKWYAGLAVDTDPAHVDERTKWCHDEEKEAEELTKYFAEGSPKERAAELTKQRDQTLILKESLETLAQAYSNDGCRLILDLRAKAKDTQKAAEIAAKMSLKIAVLDRVGSEIWLALWDVARTYSTETAYPDHEFPHVGDGARCVLCQQELGQEGKIRLKSFDDFVKAEASNVAKEVKDKLTSALADLPEMTEELMLSKAVQAGVSEENQKLLGEILRDLAARRAKLIEDTEPDEEAEAEPDTKSFVQGLKELAELQETKAKEFTESFSLEERTRKEQRKSELAAIKWISDQKPGIKAELKRKKQVGGQKNSGA